MRLLVALLLIACAARAQELHLEWSEEPVGKPVFHRFELLSEAPSGFGVPAGAKAPRFAVSFLAGKRVYVATDGNRLWLDRTFRGNFERTVPIEGRQHGGRWRVETTFPATLSAGEEEREVPVRFEWRGDDLTCEIRLWRRGYALLEGRLHAIGIRDTDADFRFTKHRDDEVYVDVDGDGRWETGEDPPIEFEPYRGDRMLRTRVPAAADCLLVERYPADRPFDVGQTRFRIDAGGNLGWDLTITEVGPAEDTWMWTPAEWDLYRHATRGTKRARAAALADEPRAKRKEMRKLALHLGQADQPGRSREAAARYLAMDGDPKWIDLALSIAVESSQLTRDAVVRRLSLERRPESLKAILRRVSHSDPELRLLAIRALASTPGPAIDRALFKQLRREKKAYVFGELQRATKGRADPEMIDLFRKDLRRGEQLQDRAAAASRLVGLGLHHQAVRDAMISTLDDPGPWESRVFLIDALRRIEQDDLFEAVARCLIKPQRQVRMAAADAMARTRRVEAIPALIEALESEVASGVRTRQVKALTSLTGENIGDMLHLWKKWWRDHGYRFKVPDKPPELKPVRKETGERRSVPTFFGLPVRETHVVFVIDQSTSMSKQPGRGGLTRLDIAKRELLSACAKLPKGAKINVVFFHREVWQWRKTMITVTPGSLKMLQRDLDKLVPIGTTALFDGLETALAEPDVRAIYLLSDGEPFGGRFDDPEEILREVATLNQLRRAVIHCISIERKSELLRRLAEAHNGRYTER